MPDDPKPDPKPDPPGDPAPDPKPDPKPDPDPDPDQLGEAGKKALDAERKARREAEAKVKELEPLANKAKELEDANKTDQQKLQDALDQAKAEGSKSTAELLKLQVALDKAPDGVSAKEILRLAKRLTGSTREELETDAEELFELVGAQTGSGGGRPPGKPNPKLRGGGDPTEDPEPDASELIKNIPPL